VRRQDQISDDELTAVGAAADAWRGGEPDRGYSMALNRFADPADVNTVYAVAHDHTGDAVGVLSLVPWGRHGLSLDVMRRRPDAPNGTTEAMVTAVMSAAAGLGISRVSLNFCMFRHVYADAEGIGAGSVTRFNYSVLGVLDRFWQFQRLYRANQKYQPQWRPRYLCFDGRVALPQVIFAVAAAEGFLPRFPTRHRHTGPQLSDEHLDQLRELDTAPSPEPSRRLPARSDQTRQRLRRLPALEAAGQPPYPIGLPEPTHQLGDLDRCDDPAGHPEPIRVAGRIRSIRDHGGAVFATLVDGSASAQLLLERDRLGSRPVRTFARLLDRGDLIVIDGHRGRSRTGTPTLFVERWRLAAKALHPVPFAHFSDPETRLRQRSTDLLVHPDQKRLLRQRSTAVRALRATLETEGFLEVETPILHTVHGGATARPFTTFINAYGVDLTLRIAPELYLKRLLVGGLGPLFELGRNFRNEGADATHNPEFTSLEAYLPYADYTTMRHLTVRLITAAAIAVHGRPILQLVHRDGATRPFDLTREWAVVPMLDAVSAALHHHVDLDTDIRHLVDHAHRHGVAVRPGMGRGAILEQLYADLVERVTIEPTFFTDFPAETSPLTGPHRSHPGLVERWDLVIGAMEIGTAYSELTDPVEQRRRLTEQSRQAAAGDPAAMVIDEDFLHALETGMPPSGGLGLGVDRIVMLLTGGNIRSVLTFPFVRPR
jgi:lysyl-tRNA synthetase, class II